ncbi:CDP-alcohol phosphatidyltransferase family protein [Sphaerisporangium fuscum]|uniref:CDP-alcohol phosphatidyltransferase family protein n=1 Tax=Sphaerisporangium fuscum TaxID=2835868 RepID=UPI002029A489|nr:CDP-alcohol phosphatidyltransferase family protein [Sphaerisporangium fuscum]
MLAVAVGLRPAGWVAGAAYAVILSAVLTFGLFRSHRRSLGPADRVTLARAVLVGGVTALVATTFAGRPAPTALIVALAAVALVLDGVDGHVARRTGTSSPLGARFDMEVDAFLILVLSVFVARSLGPWVLAIGAMRYVFVAAAWLAPWLRAPLPPSFARKTVAALQGIILAVAASGLAPLPVAAVLVGVALASLSWSFGRDTVWLFRTRVPARSRSRYIAGETPPRRIARCDDWRAMIT